MGWGIIIKEVELRGVRKEDIDSKIEESENMVAWNKERLLLMAASSPTAMHEEEDEYSDWIDYVQREVSSIMEGLKDEHFKLKLLYEARAFPEYVENF